MGAGLTDFTGRDLPAGATVGDPPKKSSALVDFTGKDVPAGASVGALPATEHVDLGGPLYSPRKSWMAKYAEAGAPSLLPDARVSSLDALPLKDQFSINYFAGQKTPDKLRSYLGSKGYQICGWDGDGNITFSDKGGRLYRANGFALAPSATNALPAIGQAVGAFGGAVAGEAALPTGGGIAGEAAGAAGGEATGEVLRNKIQRAAGVPVDETAGDIAKNAAVAGGTQAIVSGLGIPAIRSISGLKMGEEAAAAREAEIGAAGESAAQKQGGRILKQSQDVQATAQDLAKQEAKANAAETAKVEKAATAAGSKQQAALERAGTKAESAAQANRTKLAGQLTKTQKELEKFQATVHEQVTETVGKAQEQRELEAIAGRTTQDAATRSGQLIPQQTAINVAARNPYYDAATAIHERQGAMFDSAFEDVPRSTPVEAHLAPHIQSVNDFAEQNQIKISPAAKGLLNQTDNLSSEDVDPDVLRGQINEVIRGRHPDPTVNARMAEMMGRAARTGQRIQPEELNQMASRALGLSAEPANLGQLMGLRSRWLALGRGRSVSAADRWVSNRMVSAIDDELANVPGLTAENHAALEEARAQYHTYKNLFDGKLQDEVFKANDPAEIASAIFDGHKQVGLNLIDAIKDNPAAMTSLRDSYFDRVMSAGGPEKARKILAQDSESGVLRAMLGDSEYSRAQAWLTTPQYHGFAERALGTEGGRQAFQDGVNSAFGTPESRQLVDRVRQARELFERAPEPAAARMAAQSAMQSPEDAAAGVRQTGMAQVPSAVAQQTADQSAALAQQQARLANMPNPDQVRAVEAAQQRAAQSPDKAAANALYQSGQGKTGVFTGGGLAGYIKRRAAFGLIAGVMHNPAVWLAAGGEMAYDSLWALAMRTPESADAYWRFISKFSKPGWYRTAGKAFLQVNSAILDNLINEELEARRREQRSSPAGGM